MKKRGFAAALALLTAGLLGACGQNDPAYLSGIRASDYVELPDYENITVEVEAPEVTDEYLETYLSYQLSLNTETVEVTDRDDVQDGDIVNIDYVGTMDGEEFDGGSAEGYDLTIGSGSFIDGFEDGLIGAAVGETLDLELQFPDPYDNNPDYAGKDVTFTVTVNAIKERQTPELDEEFVASQAIDGVTTVEEYREYCYDLLMESAESSYDSDVQTAIMEWLDENATFLQDPPEEMVDRYDTSYIESYTEYANYYGVDLATYMTYMGYDEETYEDDIRELSEKISRQYIILQAIADEEGLNITNRVLKSALSSAAAADGYSSVDEYREVIDADAYREYLMAQKVMEYLQERVNVVEPPEEEETEEEVTEETEEEATEEAATEEAEEEASEETEGTEEAAETTAEESETGTEEESEAEEETAE